MCDKNIIIDDSRMTGMYDVALVRSAQKELKQLPPTLLAAMLHGFTKLSASGLFLQEPQVRYICEGIREVSVTSLDGQGRAFYFFMEEKRITVVHVLHKKTQTTPKHSIRLAVSRMNAVKKESLNDQKKR